jgi:Phosphotransferase enzyme family
VDDVADRARVGPKFASDAATIGPLSPGHLLARIADYGLTPQGGLRDVVLTIHSSRNPSYVVQFASGDAYFVKHPSSLEQSATIHHEASVYLSLSNAEAFRRVAPQLFHYDPSLPLLVLRAIPDAEPSDPLLITSRRSVVRAAHRLGHALALLHDLPHTPGDVSALPPPPFFLDLPPLSLRAHLSNATAELVRAVQNDAVLAAVIVRCRDSWRRTGWIHGELKWPHCLLVRSSGRGVSEPVRLVDYEFAGVGDSSWDVGCVIAAYLSSWLSSMPSPTTATAESLVSRSALSLHDLHQALATFWRVYAKRRGLSTSERMGVLQSAVQHAVARLLWTVFESCAARDALPPRSLITLQLAHNLAERPYEGLKHLLGLRWHE